MMSSTDDLSFSELVDAACDELDLELHREPEPPPPPPLWERVRARAVAAVAPRVERWRAAAARGLAAVGNVLEAEVLDLDAARGAKSNIRSTRVFPVEISARRPRPTARND